MGGKVSENEKVDKRLWTLSTNWLLAWGYFPRSESVGREQQGGTLECTSHSKRAPAWVRRLSQNSSRMAKVTGCPRSPGSPPVWLRGRRDNGEVTRLAQGPERARDKAIKTTPDRVSVLTFAITFTFTLGWLTFTFQKMHFTWKAQTFQTESSKQTLVTVRETTRKKPKQKTTSWASGFPALESHPEWGFRAVHVSPQKTEGYSNASV